MKDSASRTGIGIAVAAGIIAVVWTAFVPYGYPWPSIAWAILAGAAAVWVFKGSVPQEPSMNDVISGVEHEPRTAVAPKSGAADTRAAS